MLAYSRCGRTIEVYASDFTAELQPHKERRDKLNTYPYISPWLLSKGLAHNHSVQESELCTKRLILYHKLLKLNHIATAYIAM